MPTVRPHLPTPPTPTSSTQPETSPHLKTAPDPEALFGLVSVARAPPLSAPLWQLSPANVSSVLWACAQLGYRHPRLLQGLWQLVVRHAAACDPPSLTQCAWALAQLGIVTAAPGAVNVNPSASSGVPTPGPLSHKGRPGAGDSGLQAPAASTSKSATQRAAVHTTQRAAAPAGGAPPEQLLALSEDVVLSLVLEEMGAGKTGAQHTQHPSDQHAATGSHVSSGPVGRSRPPATRAGPVAGGRQDGRQVADGASFLQEYVRGLLRQGEQQRRLLVGCVAGVVSRWGFLEAVPDNGVVQLVWFFAKVRGGCNCD